MDHAMPLKGLDFAVIAAYFAVTLAAGLFMGRFVKNAGDFFSGGIFTSCSRIKATPAQSSVSSFWPFRKS